ncbi:hypothetical protein ACFUJV_03540 [Streptomyces olivaceus]|nr:hypothetical protein [Streptomyces sp. CB09030]UOG83889.1 hypothetical protein L6J92_34090 [Streptomyces sp. CB09030]
MAEVVVGAVGMAVVLKGGVEGVAVVAAVADEVVVVADGVVVVVAVARWTGGGVRPSGAAVPGPGRRVAGCAESAVGPGSGAPSGARCGGCADGVAEAGDAGDAGVRRAASGVAAWRTASTGPEEVGAPRPPRRGAAALLCTGCVEAGGLPVPGWERGTAGGCPAWAAVPGAVPRTGRWTGGDAGVAEGAPAPPAGAASTARCTGAGADGAGAGAVDPGAVGPWGVVVGVAGPVGADPDRDGDGDFAGPEAAARRWTGGCAPAGAAERFGPLDEPLAAGEGAAEREAPVVPPLPTGRAAGRAGSPPGAGAGLTRATARWTGGGGAVPASRCPETGAERSGCGTARWTGGTDAGGVASADGDGAEEDGAEEDGADGAGNGVADAVRSAGRASVPETALGADRWTGRSFAAPSAGAGAGTDGGVAVAPGRGAAEAGRGEREAEGPDSVRWTGGWPVVPLCAGPGCGTARCTGAPDAGLLPGAGEGRLRAGPSPGLGRAVAARWTGRPEASGGVAGRGAGVAAESPRAGAGPPPESPVAGWAGVPPFRAGGLVVRAGVPGVAASVGAGLAPVAVPESREARWTGVPDEPAPSCAGSLLRRAGVPGAAVPPDAGAPESRGARWTGVPDEVPLSPAGAAARGAGRDGGTAERCTGGVAAGPSPLTRGARCTGVPDGVPRDPVSGAAPGRAAARCTGGPAGEPVAAGGRCCGRTARCAGASGAAAGGVEGAAGVPPERPAGEGLSAGAAPGSPRSPSADEDAVPDEAVPDEAVPDDAVPDDAVPDDAVPDEAVPDVSGAGLPVRRLAGRARRWTAGVPDGALVRACRGLGAAGGTGVTCTPRAARTGGLAGAEDDADPAERARWTGVAEAAVDAAAEDGLGAEVGVAGAGAGAGAPDAPPRAPAPREPPAAPEVRLAEGETEGVEGEAAEGEGRAPGAGPVGAVGAGASAGIARSGATGIRCTGAVPAPGASGVDGFRRAAGSNAPDSRLSPAAGFSTAGDGAPVNDGFCHVGRRPPKPASATPARAPPVARWIGGRPVQAATATGAGPVEAAVPPPVSGAAPVSGPEPASGSGRAGAADAAAAPPPLPSAPSRRPRSRSRNPTDQPSAVPRVTRDAIWSVYRRRS